MFTQQVTITYRDGHKEHVTTDQGDVQAFEFWAMRRGLSASRPDRTLIQEAPVTFLRVAAWSAVQRGSGTKLDFDLWADTVADVQPEDVEAADPTPEGILAEG
jgi:hypothetical protein